MALAVFGVEVAFAPVVDIDGKHQRIDEGSTEGFIGIGAQGVGVQPQGEIVPDGLRDEASVCGIDVSEEDEAPQEHLPVGFDEALEAVPVEASTAGSDEVGDIGSVKALAAGDKDFRGDGLFGGDDATRNIEDFMREGAVDPWGIDDKDGVAEAGDEVDEVFTAKGLGEPYGIFDLSFEADLLKMLEGKSDGFWFEEEIEVFCGSPDAGVAVEGKCSGDSEGDMRLGEALQDSAVTLKSLRQKFGRGGGTDRQRGLVLRHTRGRTRIV